MTSTARAAGSRMRLKYLLRRGFANGIFKKKDDYGRGTLLVNVADLYAPNAVVDDSKLARVDVTADELETFGVQEGDVFFVRSSLKLEGIAVAARAGTALEPRVFECHVVGVRPDTDRVDPRFLTYQLNAEPVRSSTVSRATTTTMTTISQDHLADIRVWCPPLDVQSRIANYLDAEVSRIDALTGGKQRVLDLLAEKRKAIIATAVTRGLDPKVKLRDSGVPWLGEIPAHWEIERARWLFRERDVRSTTGEEEMLTVSHLTGVTPRSEKDVNMFEAETNEGYKLCEPGDLVINTLWAWMGAMGIAPVKGIVSPAYNVYEPGPRLAPAYIDALVRLPVFAQEVTRYSKGVWSSRLRLYPEGFFEVYLPVPPQEEQLAVVEHIARETAKLDAVRAATERTIALLKERRSALIAAAVTGQLDVGAAA